ncbi:AIPR family protein [Desulfosporosinus nitroreducens]|nr:AIPR family protein [Desulfosporosinus nitroreducens]MCO1603868.1 AIPR family protein [Desulfosporosinus nitroreducens]
MKLTQIGKMDQDRATELIRNISRSSNSQNKVSDADFFATHPFHVRMEQFSRRIFAQAEGAQYEQNGSVNVPADNIFRRKCV